MNATKPVMRLLGAALAASCLLLSGCREPNEPVKPITGLAAAVAATLH